MNDDEKLHQSLARSGLISHPSDAELQEWVDRIQAGEHGEEIDDLSRAILADFVTRQAFGVQQSPVVMSWIAESFNQILDHADPREALGLLPRVNHRIPSPERAWDVACWISAAQGRGYSQAEAVTAAAETFHVDDSTVHRYLRSKPAQINSAVDWEAYFIACRRPLPPQKKSTGRK